MRQLHNAITISLITASFIAAAAIVTPTIAEAAPVPTTTSPASNLAATPPASEQATAPNTPDSGPWRSPVGTLDLLTRFDPPPEPWLAGHRGVDLAAGSDLPVTAAGAGTVVFADDLAGRGVVSVLHSNGLRTTYEPLEPLVATGDAVTAGQTIGHLQPGHASCPGQTCLHLGLKRGPLYLDPMLLFGEGKVRLLPRPARPERLSGARSLEQTGPALRTIRADQPAESPDLPTAFRPRPHACPHPSCASAEPLAIPAAQGPSHTRNRPPQPTGRKEARP